MMMTLVAALSLMSVRSDDLPNGGTVPRKAMARECGGQNRSPDLDLANPPHGVKSFAIVLHDPDAPVAGGFYHWVVYNLPPTRLAIPGNAAFSPSQAGRTSLGSTAYYGPCPPPGPAHHYTLTIYALDLAHIAASSPLTGPQLEVRIRGHVITRAVLTSIAAHP